MIRARNDAGGGKVGTIFFLLLVAAGVYFGLQFIPVLVDTYSFKDSMSEEAKFASSRSDEAIQNNLLRRARELDLPINAKQIKITRNAGRIIIKADYTVEVETILFTYPWHFQEQTIREMF